jgi:transposase
MMQRMLGMRDLKVKDLHGLSPSGLAMLAAQMLEHIQQQDEQLGLQDQELQRKRGEIEAKAAEIEIKAAEIGRKDREIAWRDAKLEKVNFELARLKRWKFGAKSEAMTAEQRLLFQDTLAEDEASLRAQLAALQAGLPETPKAPKAPRAKPRRQPLSLVPVCRHRPQATRTGQRAHKTPQDTGRPIRTLQAMGQVNARAVTVTGTGNAAPPVRLPSADDKK